MSEKNERNYFRKKDREDYPGEKEKRDRMRSLFHRNKQIYREYDKDLAAVCHNGIFVGQETDGVISYKGIPFAEPPVGNLRWKPSQRAKNSDFVMEAYYYGYAPIQTEWPSEEGSYYPQSEDCLTLNIWTSKKKTSGKKAVMVFFHGGSYGWGATSDPMYDGHNLVSAHPEVVLVTCEYRVGMMGFINFSEVEGGEEYKESGNLGLLDHITALEWIRDNISAFGGDKDNVTIFGESAGGGTVSLLPIMKNAKGLFKRAIAESGSIALTYNKEHSKKLTRKLLEITGCSDMRSLMELSESEIRIINEDLNDINNFPIRDGIVLPENLYEAYENGEAADIDMINGTNSDEVRYWIREMSYNAGDFLGRTVFKLGIPVMFNSDMLKVSPADRKLIDDFLLFCPGGRKLWKLVEFYNEILFRIPAVKQSEENARNGGKAYMYYWTYPSEHIGLFACHAVELAYVFGNLDVQIYTGDNIDPELSREVQQMWVNFAKTGDPSTDEHKWNPYSEKDPATMIFGREITAARNHFSERNEILKPVLKYGINGCYTDLKIKIPLIYKIAAVLAGIVGAIPAGIYFGVKYIRKRIKSISGK